MGKSRRQWQLAPHRPAKETIKKKIKKDKKKKQVTKVVFKTTTNTRPPPLDDEPQVDVGAQFNISHLLSSSSPSRNYLITSNHSRVNIVDRLSGKYILLIFYGLSDLIHTPRFTHSRYMTELEELYNDKKEELEIIFIGFGDNREAFDHSISTMPWLAIPHEDYMARAVLQTMFHLPGRPYNIHSLLFDPQGVVLQKYPMSLILGLGPKAFPFTMHKIDQACCLHPLALWDQLVLEKKAPCLTLLLGDTLLSPGGNKVITAELDTDEKIVALYFFEYGYKGIRRTKELLEIWDALKECGNREFEIIFINEDVNASRYFLEDDFIKKFGRSNPWYKLPNRDNRELSRLLRVGNCLDERDGGYFIILKPDRYEPISYFAFNIIDKFGLTAYPFTMEAVVDLSVKELRKLKLTNLLLPPSLLETPGQDFGTDVSNLLGERVLLVFATDSCLQFGQFMRSLINMYNDQKGSDDCFNVIYVQLESGSEYNFDTSVKGIPWFVLPFEPDCTDWVVQGLFGSQFPSHQLPAVAAFDRDGFLEAIDSNLNFKEVRSSFPFIKDEMTEVVRREISNTHKWDLHRFHFPEFTSRGREIKY